jgi:hypothetical protein
MLEGSITYENGGRIVLDSRYAGQLSRSFNSAGKPDATEIGLGTEEFFYIFGFTFRLNGDLFLDLLVFGRHLRIVLVAVRMKPGQDREATIQPAFLYQPSGRPGKQEDKNRY